MDHKSQNKKIEAWLRAGKSIDPLLALRRFGCLRLSGRIYDLKATGLNIIPTLVTKNGRRYAEYRLAEKS